MVSVNRNRSKGTEQEKTNAASVLNEFTHAARYLQNISSDHLSKAGDISACNATHTDMIEELQKAVKRASRRSELGVKDRLDLEGKSRNRLSRYGLSVDKMNESLSGLVDMVKGPAYISAVRRIQKITNDLNKLTEHGSEAASHMLETAINDVNTPVRSRAAAKKPMQEEPELQVTKDLRLIRRVAIIEELAKRLGEQIDRRGRTGIKSSIREDSPYRGILHHKEINKENKQLEHVQASGGRVIDSTHIVPQHAAPERTAAGMDENIQREQALVDKHMKIDGGAASTSIKSGSEQQLAINLEGLGAAERIIRQQEIMEANVGKHMGAVRDKIDLAFGKDRNSVSAKELGDISDANVKLFIEINVYTDMLLNMKGRLKEVLPGNDKEAKAQREAQKKTISSLLKRFESDSRHANDMIADFAKKKDFGVSKVPIFKHEVKNIQAELYNVGDSSGNMAYKRFGAGILFYENYSGSGNNVKQVDEDYKEIIKRLGNGSRTILSGYEEHYADISELVIAQLAVIGVQLDWQEGDGRKRDRRLLQEVFMPNVFRK